MPPPISPVAGLRARLDELADGLDSVVFGLAVPGASDRRSRTEEASRIVRRYLVPRLDTPPMPLLVTVFGPTGAGKSTLLNSLAGRNVSDPGALRPTTRRPVLWCHRRNLDAVRRLGLDATVEADDHPLLESLSLVDTPDLDSYVAEHADMARSVLEVSDAAVYVTTPQRYADAVPWEVVQGLVERRLPLVVVANRLSRRSSGAVSDLASLLRKHGWERARADDIVRVQEQRLRADGRLTRSAVERLRGRLVDLVAEAEQTVRTTTTGAVDGVVAATRQVADELDRQHAEGELIREAAAVGYRQQAEEIEAQLASGDLVREEVVARWQRMVGVGDLASVITRGWGRLRDLVSGSGPVPPERMEQVGAEARRELADLAVVRAQRAVTAAVTAWEIEPGARALIDEGLRRTDPDLVDWAEAEVDEWLGGLVDLIEEQGRSRFRVARLASVGINAAATMLLLGVFASTGGITGAEVGVAAGTAAAQQTVLEHLFGSAASSRLAVRARTDLAGRLGDVLRRDSERFDRAVDAAVDPPESAGRLRAAADAVAREARRG